MHRDARSGRLWAVTSYFNPVPFRRRLENYRVFRERLAAPLLTVELAHGPEPELGEGDADILVRLCGGDVMWQKERLLNIAVSRLPDECDRVAWLDCDIVLADPDWPERIDAALDDFAVVQGFGRALQIDRSWRPGEPIEGAVERSRPSICKAIADGLSPEGGFDLPYIDGTILPSTGFAWAARRDLLAAEGLYDAAIIGSGDRLLAAASYGYAAEAANRYAMHGARLGHYLDWAKRWQAAVAGSVGVLDGAVFNLWHGELSNRRYAERQLRLDEFGFDPNVDIALDAQGAWRWNSDKPAMHAYLRDYFASRREDG